MNSAELTRLSKLLIEWGHRLWQQGMLPGGDGNISVKIDAERILITPSGMSKGFLKDDDLIVVDFSSNVLQGKNKPSSEISLHILAYQYRPDISAVVHAHPPYATAFACSKIELPQNLLPESIVKLGEVPKTFFALPSTMQTAVVAEPFVLRYNAFLLKNHGAVTLGRNLEEACLRMETLEHLAKVAWLSKLLGEVTELPEWAVKKLKEIGLE